MRIGSSAASGAGRSEKASIPVGKLVILPFEGMPGELVDALAQELRERGATVAVDAALPLPESAYARARDQYRASALLDVVRGRRAPHVLALTERDLFVEGLNFVFGMADVAGRACVVSTARLAADGDEALFRARILKEIMHEIGHMLGLKHCPDMRCVMYFSNSILDTDRKSAAYCKDCLHRVTPGTRAQQT
jgi:archaemetzincin